MKASEGQRHKRLLLTLPVEPDLLARVRDEWEIRVDIMVERLFAAGKITNKHADKDFFTRLIHVHEEFPGVSILLHKDTAVMGDACRELWAHPKVLNVLEQLIGPEIVGHGTWNIRVKVPKHGPEVVGWHQVSLITSPSERWSNGCALQ